ncbi:hypothetical protein [Mycobacterium sp. OTB74]|uniref:hypothetical protein n=1 Tax=Mycobacterium sp. OTB74 TaxID=1853452 RepID=UPI002475D8E4|nr:hypothetical protein [Mycobacterium sp. OTB74]MDH6245512.1 hypothetical protein [Mycobacterium sp. OTB74]
MSDQATNQDPVDAPASSIHFEVLGQPPLKNEALSVFNAKHGQAERILALLRAARRACLEHGFAPIETGGVALAVITRSSAGDATNILGGIADVLENKPVRAHRSSIDHLGDLATVWLYQDDKKIKQITYREERGEPSYTVTVRALRDASP